MRSSLPMACLALMLLALLLLPTVAVAGPCTPTRFVWAAGIITVATAVMAPSPFKHTSAALCPQQWASLRSGINENTASVKTLEAACAKFQAMTDQIRTQNAEQKAFFAVRVCSGCSIAVSSHIS